MSKRALRSAGLARAEEEQTMSAVTQRYNVGGVFLQRPFKVRRLGHFGFNVERLPEGREFYGDLLGFTASETLDFSRARGSRKIPISATRAVISCGTAPTTTPSCCSRSGSWTTAPTANSHPR